MKRFICHERFGKLEIGDVMSYWHDTGCFGGVLCFARIIKFGGGKIKLRDENGSEYWRYPDYFAEVVAPEAVALLHTIDGITV